MGTDNGFSQTPFRLENNYGSMWGAPVIPGKWDIIDTSTGTYTSCANPTILGSIHPVNGTGSYDYSPTNGLYDTFTAATGTSASRAVNTIKVTGKTWAANQWSLFTVRRLKDDKVNVIETNTVPDIHGITMLVTTGTDTGPPVFSPGDEFEIRRSLILVDQPGRGQCSDPTSGAQLGVSVDAASAGVNTSSFTGSGVLYVQASSVFNSFANSGTLLIVNASDNHSLVDYTGKSTSPNRFTGLRTRSNGATLLATGNSITGYYQGCVNTVSGTVSWPHQALEPSYGWNNVYVPTGLHMKIYGTIGVSVPDGYPGSTVSLENRDFYNDKPAGVQTSKTTPFDGSSGVGYGSLANRPDHCTPGTDVAGYTTNPPGVGYFDEDSKTFYVCTGPDTWTPEWSTYTYPHPLVSGVPRARRNLRIVP